MEFRISRIVAGQNVTIDPILHCAVKINDTHIFTTAGKDFPYQAYIWKWVAIAGNSTQRVSSVSFSQETGELTPLPDMLNVAESSSCAFLKPNLILVISGNNEVFARAIYVYRDSLILDLGHIFHM